MRLHGNNYCQIYDFPVYYDLVFGSDCAAEMEFLKNCFDRYVDGKVKRLFEPACGTGRLIYRFGRDKYDVSGVDLNDKAIEFCNKRLERYDIKGRAFVGDMSDFSVKKPYDAAFNTINSFRHLPSEAAAVGHLKCMAAAVRKGGIYALGLHLTPTRGETSDEESWSARRGQLAINTYMWPVDKNPRKRMEQFGIKFDVYKPTGICRFATCSNCVRTPPSSSRNCWPQRRNGKRSRTTTFTTTSADRSRSIRKQRISSSFLKRV